jgi:ABC-type uncharacterized transport system involved in gliding motility auxiliary subunit
MATQEQKRKAAAQTGIYLLVIAAIAVVANVLAAGAYKRFDTTKNERYTLSVGSGRLVKNLKTPIQVEACVTKGLAQLDAFVRDLTDLLKEYKRAGGNKFEFTIVEANTEELKNRCKESGLEPMAFGEASATGEDQASIAQGFMGLVFKYGSEKEVIPQLHPARGEGMEFWITNKIREIRDKSEDIKHRIGVVSGKDELKLSDSNLLPKQGRQGGAPSIQSIIEQTFPFYKLEEVELKEDAAIDEKLDGLIITQPRKDYTEKELQRVDEFLMRGNKSLAVFASAVGMKPQDPSMQATLNLHGLDKLLLGYGIDMKKNAVFDYGAQFGIAVPTATGQVVPIRHPGIAHVISTPGADEGEQTLDNGFAAFFRMDEVAFPFASTLEIKKDKQPADVKYKVVARTTEAAGIVSSDTIDMKLKAQWQPKPPFERRAIAASVEGKLKSAFATKAEGITSPDRAAQPSRVLVIASSLFLTNPFAYAGNGPDLGPQFQMFGGAGGDPQLQMIANPYAQRYLTNTILSVKNTLDWMSGDADLLAASAKIMQDPNLTYADVSKPKLEAKDDEAAIRKKDEDYKAARKTVQKSVQWTLTLGVPLLFAAFGIGRWRYRETQKDKRKA